MAGSKAQSVLVTDDDAPYYERCAGIDMSHFRNQHAFSNWTGTAPGNNESAGKRKSGRTSHGNKTLKSTLTQFAKSAQKVKSSFFSAQYARLAAHRGKNRATMAVAHSMAIAVFFALSGMEFKDPRR